MSANYFAVCTCGHRRGKHEVSCPLQRHYWRWLQKQPPPVSQIEVVRAAAPSVSTEGQT